MLNMGCQQNMDFPMTIFLRLEKLLLMFKCGIICLTNNTVVEVTNSSKQYLIKPNQI